MQIQVILVNKKDKMIGIGEKLQTHIEGKLHRAFSIFIFNKNGELLIQKRAENKYHSAGLWSNTCCSHPRPGEKTTYAASKRLEQEMGIKVELKKIFSFIYKTEVCPNLVEYEYDHVYFGDFDKDPIANEMEVSDWKWISLDNLISEIKKNPDHYTKWLKLVIEKVRVARVNTL